MLLSRLQASPKNVLLLGARQVGKSTLARTLKPDMIINLAAEEVFLSYAKDPSRLGRELNAMRRRGLVLIDEIQRLPALLNSVQALLDEGLPHRFLLTGSSARKLKRGGANLLPGRVVLEYLDPLSIWEMGEAFDLERVLRLGSLPGIYSDHDYGAETLGTYASIYLREEIQAEALVRDVGTYARFLDVAAAQSGDWVNYAKLASDAEISKETLRRFYQILEETLVAFRIPPTAPTRGSRRISQRDRFIFFDVGVRNALLGSHLHPPSPTERGKLFEQWFILQCISWIRAQRLPWQVSAYRTEAGAEVDLVIDTGTRYLAIECKAGKKAETRQLNGIRSFAEVASKPVDGVVVFQGERAQQLTDRIDAVPYRHFLLERLPKLSKLS